MLTPTTATTPATTTIAPTTAVPGPTSTPAPAPKPIPTSAGATEAPLAPQPATNEPAPASTTQKMSPIMLWYAVSVYAYAAAFKKAANDIMSSPDGNGLFPMDQDINQPVQATKGDQMDADTKAYYDLNSKAIDSVIKETKADKNGNPLTDEQKIAERDAAIFDPEEAEGPDEPEVTAAP